MAYETVSLPVTQHFVTSALLKLKFFKVKNASFVLCALVLPTTLIQSVKTGNLHTLWIKGKIAFEKSLHLWLNMASQT